MKFSKLLVIIPTRNRAEFAINAVQSVLRQEACDFVILVSDNSTEESAVSTLAEYCRQLDDDRVRYVRPKESLAMAPHWNWALHEGLEMGSISHVTILTDRMQFLDGSLADLQNVLTDFAERVVSFGTDAIRDNESPVTLWQLPWSGKVYEISSAHLTAQFANINIVYHALPRMMNSAVPIGILKRLHNRFGDFFSSVSPDFNFAFRVLDEVESIYYYDKGLLIGYGAARSNGVSFVSGNLNKEAQDFKKNLTVTNVSFDTPINDIWIMPNTILHEYFEVQQKSRQTDFPEIDKEKYLQSLVENVFAFGNVEMRSEMFTRLESRLGKSMTRKYLFRSKLQRYLSGIKIRLHNLSSPSSPHLVLKQFDDVNQALSYANDFRRPPCSDNKDLLKDRFGGYGPGVTVIRETSN